MVQVVKGIGLEFPNSLLGTMKFYSVRLIPSDSPFALTDIYYSLVLAEGSLGSPGILVSANSPSLTES